jgi:hypothetical protein
MGVRAGVVFIRIREYLKKNGAGLEDRLTSNHYQN